MCRQQWELYFCAKWVGGPGRLRNSGNLSLAESDLDLCRIDLSFNCAWEHFLVLIFGCAVVACEGASATNVGLLTSAAHSFPWGPLSSHLAKICWLLVVSATPRVPLVVWQKGWHRRGAGWCASSHSPKSHSHIAPETVNNATRNNSPTKRCSIFLSQASNSGHDPQPPSPTICSSVLNAE